MLGEIQTFKDNVSNFGSRGDVIVRHGRKGAYRSCCDTGLNGVIKILLWDR